MMRTKDPLGKAWHKFCAPVCVLPWKPEQFWHEKEKKTKKSMRFFSTALLVSGFFFLFFQVSVFALCGRKIWDDRISFTYLLGLSGTARILAKGLDK